jgi:CheY-like chemotaxis protein
MEQAGKEDRHCKISIWPMGEEYRHRILVVEDNADTRLLLLHLLQGEFDLTICCSVDDAIEAASGSDFELLIIDINLGEQRTGIDVLEYARLRPRGGAVPAIAMTAYAMPGDRERFLKLGFTAYLAKPFTRRHLLNCVHELTSRVRG